MWLLKCRTLVGLLFANQTHFSNEIKRSLIIQTFQSRRQCVILYYVGYSSETTCSDLKICAEDIINSEPILSREQSNNIFQNWYENNNSLIFYIMFYYFLIFYFLEYLSQNILVLVNINKQKINVESFHHYICKVIFRLGYIHIILYTYSSRTQIIYIHLEFLYFLIFGIIVIFANYFYSIGNKSVVKTFNYPVVTII